ncbi:hypothetical protein F4777DRAFT_27960 [Nemania sp. FL0916]|nr:hypothetical protein F4777DRAFT_27960 [Nemania sp. FL0916]
MADIMCLPPPLMRVVDKYMRRAEIWVQLPGDQKDRFWKMDNPDGTESFTAGEIVMFTEQSCLLAAASVDDGLIEEFRAKFRTDWERNNTSPFQGRDFAKTIGEYIVWIDRIFFFGLITRPAREAGGELRAQQYLFTLKFDILLDDWEGNELHGAFDSTTGTFRVAMWQRSGEPQPFDQVLCTVIHELAHVYLGILTREHSATNYLRDIYQNSGHGAQFHRLLGSVFALLHEWLPNMTRLGELAAQHEDSMISALAVPLISEAAARAYIRDNPLRLRAYRV